MRNEAHPGARNPQRHEVLTIERQELAMETLGMSLSEGKALLAGVQEFLISQQAHEYQQQRPCTPCGWRHTRRLRKYDDPRYSARQVCEPAMGPLPLSGWRF
jgi:hypothetical protein